MTTAISYLAYTSKITLASALHRRTFLDILAESQRNNQVSHVTGFLLFKNGLFFQFIEGEDIIIRQLYAAIQRDTRHRNVTTLIEGETNQRHFQQWAMYCLDLGEEIDVNEISALFEDYDTYHWDNHHVKQVISDMQRLYQSRQLVADVVQPVSYTQALIQRFFQQHSVFIVLQLGFILLGLLILVYTWWVS